ncbi:deoxyribonuclease IV [Candidatus Absconditicoccus praedator]|uniref:deoxyribonuclease IV n=1 Tax=Candidatus Absconditicoccus praedator TaxID=2735562 RepID=UPI001E42FD28|nr:deoxyribonuclease IV [Candidatus Absconditicoccus praedator]UFX83043.1 deoxyribonuclease IV [Candidatus Absconditicoccus praedator]
MFSIGAHTSIAGGIQNSIPRSHSIGADALQIFAKSPRGWFYSNDKITDDIVQKCQQSFSETNHKYGMIHSVYLINLAKAPKDAAKDVDSVIDDFKIADRIGFSSVNVHLGKYSDMTKQQTFQNMAENLAKILEATKDYDVDFLFENTSGQGTEVGYRFDELAEFYDFLKKFFGQEYVEQKVKFCFDTAHGWGAGYDLNDFGQVMDEFDKFLGKDNLYCFHLNDSKAICGSRLDRHASLGRGFVGLNALFQVVDWAYDNNKPIILETPDPDLRSEEIQMIRKYISGEFSGKEILDFNNKYFMTEYLKKFEKYITNQYERGFFG